MRAALLAIALVAGCASEADLVLELHKTMTDSAVAFAVCDAAHPSDCADVEGTSFGGDLVLSLGIYFDSAIEPPLSVRLEQSNPSTCRMLDIVPATERSLVVITFPSAADGPLLLDCDTCAQRDEPPCL